jgi:LysM repeat protein
MSQRQVPPTQTTSYRPPTLVEPSAPKKSPVIATPSKSTASQKLSTYRPPSTHSSSKTSGNTIESKVTRQQNSDFRQDIRLGHLEQNVGLLPDSIEKGGVTDLAPIGSHYIVRPGDTLLGIAARHGTSTNALRSLNHLDDDVVDIGQSLLIPHPGGSSPSGGKFTGVHIVKSGDTLTKLARNFGISTDALARANATVHPDRLLIGERLLVPSSSSSSFESASFSTSSSKSTTHIVRKGEHLGSIAKRYGVSTSALALTNSLKNANIIEIGDRLVIPSHSSSRSTSQLTIADPDAAPLADFRIPETSPLSVNPEPIAPLPPISSNMPTLTSVTSSKTRGVVAYRMERGDTLDSVANMFSTTTENIRALNQFPSDKVLKEGDELFVPSIGAVSVN